ncbi:MAG: DUF4381 domain-containing protein [Pseudomonadota bacterium]
MTPAGSGDPLAGLRDIRLPAPVSFWPPAPGWWIVAGLVLVLLLVALILEYRRRQTLAYRVQLQWRAMARDEARFADSRALAAAGAVLMRRVLLSRLDTAGAATLTGDAWERALESGKGALPAGMAAFLARAPYLPPDAPGADAVERAALVQAVRHWIRSQA